MKYHEPISESTPVFPCWLWNDGMEQCWERHRYRPIFLGDFSHWSNSATDENPHVLQIGLTPTKKTKAL